MKRNAGGASANKSPTGINLLSKWYAGLAMAADRELAGAPLAVGLWLLEHTNPDSGAAWPSVATLVRCTGVSERAAQRAIDTLVARGWFKIPDRSGGRSRSTRYYFDRFAESPSSVAALKGESPPSVAEKGVTNRQERVPPATPDSPNESSNESGQRKLRVFGKVEGGKSAAAPPATKALGPADRVRAALDKAGWDVFTRNLPKPLIVIGQANRLEAEREGEGVALIRATFAEVTRVRAAGGAA